MFFTGYSFTIITLIAMIVIWYVGYGKKFRQNLKENTYFESDAS